MRPPGADERGMSDSVQWAMLTPLVLLTVLGMIQAGIWLYGRSVAADAAITGAEAAAVLDADPDQARELAQQVADKGGLREVTVERAMGATTVTVTVTGRIPTFLDLGPGEIVHSATRPLERLTRPAYTEGR
ncbi:MAG: TadE/TadG family type IV pilus assembly protein [Propioniciclava sp.]